MQAACTFFDEFKDNKDGTVTDPRNGLVWKRCAEGFTWSGSICKGSEKKMDWFEAMQTAKQSRFLGKADWRIPSRVEFASVVGDYDDCKNFFDAKVGQFAASKSITHLLKSENYQFWSFSTHKDPAFTHSAWVISFSKGGDYVANSQRSLNVRFVRDSHSSDSEATLEFKTEYAKIKQYKGLKAAEETEDKQANARKAKDEARQAQANRDRVANECNGLYVGKPVSYTLTNGCLFGCKKTGVITGIGSGVVGVRSSEDGEVREKACTELN